MAGWLVCHEGCGGGQAGVAFVHTMGGDGGVSAVVMHRFEIEEKKTYLNVLWSQVCRAVGCLGVGVPGGVGGCSRVACVCVKGQLETKGTKGLPFFLAGGVVAMPAKGDVAAMVVSQLTPCTTSRRKVNKQKKLKPKKKLIFCAPRDLCECECTGWLTRPHGVAWRRLWRRRDWRGSSGVKVAVTGVSGGSGGVWPVCARGDGDVTAATVLHRFEMKGKKKTKKKRKLI